MTAREVCDGEYAECSRFGEARLAFVNALLFAAVWAFGFVCGRAVAGLPL